MSDKRIIDLEAKQTLGSGDYLAADSAQGTYKVDANTNIMTPLANVRNNVANSSASPDKYSSSTAYKVGDMVIQNDILYKCTTACSAASWAVNSACFTATTLASAITQLNSDLSGDVLWQGDTNYTSPYTINLSSSYQNYKKLLFFLTVNMYDGRSIIREASCEQIDYIRAVGSGDIKVSMCWGYSDKLDYFDIQPISTLTSLMVNSALTKCVKVIGLKHY